MKSSIFQNTTEKFDRFLPSKVYQHKFKYLVYKIFLIRNLSNFSVVFWKIDDFIKDILRLSDLYHEDQRGKGIRKVKADPIS